MIAIIAAVCFALAALLALRSQRHILEGLALATAPQQHDARNRRAPRVDIAAWPDFSAREPIERGRSCDEPWRGHGINVANVCADRATRATMTCVGRSPSRSGGGGGGEISHPRPHARRSATAYS